MGHDKDCSSAALAPDHTIATGRGSDPTGRGSDPTGEARIPLERLGSHWRGWDPTGEAPIPLKGLGSHWRGSDPTGEARIPLGLDPALARIQRSSLANRRHCDHYKVERINIRPAAPFIVHLQSAISDQRAIGAQSVRNQRANRAQSASNEHPPARNQHPISTQSASNQHPISIRFRNPTHGPPAQRRRDPPERTLEPVPP